MVENSYKIKEETEKGRSFFSFLEELKITMLFEDGLPVQYIPHAIFLAFVGVFYIGNTHYAERTIRKIEILEVEVEELRADYTSLKADYMFSSKQSEVAKKVKELGLEESMVPPNKIIIKAGEY